MNMRDTKMTRFREDLRNIGSERGSGGGGWMRKNETRLVKKYLRTFVKKSGLNSDECTKADKLYSHNGSLLI